MYYCKTIISKSTLLNSIGDHVQIEHIFSLQRLYSGNYEFSHNKILSLFTVSKKRNINQTDSFKHKTMQRFK